MPSEQHGGIRESKRKSHFRVTTCLSEPTGEIDRFGDNDYKEVVRYYDRQHHFWYVVEDSLYVGLRNEHGEMDFDQEGYIAVFNEWSSVEDCDDPEVIG